jgi:hypothetical protein
MSGHDYGFRLRDYVAYVYDEHEDVCPIVCEGICDWEIPVDLEKLKLDTLLKIPIPILLRNSHGPNHNKRGTKHEAEIEEFVNEWLFDSPFITAKDFLIGCYRLKSHKFENWHERIYGYDDYDETSNPLVVELLVDHGS